MITVDVLSQSTARLGDGIEVREPLVITVAHVEAAVEQEAGLRLSWPGCRAANVLPAPRGKVGHVHS
jgi:hypothetical protein